MRDTRLQLLPLLLLSWYFTSTETIRLIRDGRRWEKREIFIYPSLHWHHQNDSCITVGSDESHFNVSLIIVMDKVTRQCPQPTTFLKRMESQSGTEPSAYQPNALPLGQTGPSSFLLFFILFLYITTTTIITTTSTIITTTTITTTTTTTTIITTSTATTTLPTPTPHTTPSSP